MTPFSFTAFGLAMIPYMVWNFWFGIGPARGMLTNYIWLDFVGNAFFGLGSLYCAKLLKEEEQEKSMKGK
jgi:ABC-type multidrug transport system permease subunit